LRKHFIQLFILAACFAAAIFAQQPPPPAQSNQPQTPTTSPASPQVAQAPPAPVTSTPHIGLTTVVLDAAHGGADTGARGAGGINEKELTLVLARAVKSQLEARGLRVVLTRDGDQNPSFDDRAAIANARNGAVFVTLHVGSTGAAGTARVYYFAGPMSSAADAEKSAWVRWDEAQYRFT
jgi:N-acetylmuramoyl-L-alanine amidase